MILEDFKQIKHFIFDIDGVLTDGSLLLLNDGQYLRTMNIKDGYALQLAVKKGYSITIISGATGDVLTARFKGLGITDVHLGISDKLTLLQKITFEKNIDTTCCLYMGDDMPDYEAMKLVGIASCPADAVNEIKSISQYKAIAKGGEGCAREVIEKTLKQNDHWDLVDHIRAT
jgi:3-deoxy-D-manno-octulosonate 8-phosphate phosphatase (KDO 8-P phosphatase)